MSEPVKIMSAKFDPNARVYCIKYQADRNGYWAELTLESVEPARPEFDEAFDAMAPDFCALIAMSPDAYNPEADPMSRVHVSQVTKVVKKDTVSYSFTAKIFNPTTCRFQNVSLPSVDVTNISREIMDHIDILFHEASLYVQGKRAQGSMFDEK